MSSVRPFVAAAFLVLPASLYAQFDASTLRWVRGRVISNASGTIVLQLRDARPLSIACDERCGPASPGSLVELHYLDRRGERRGEFLFVGLQADGELSKKPGRSARGVVTRTRKSSVQLQVGTKKRTYELEKKTTLVEPGQWQPAATGRAEVIGRLKTGEEILLKYVEQDASIQAGDVTIPGTALKGIEVRRLKR